MPALNRSFAVSNTFLANLLDLDFVVSGFRPSRMLNLDRLRTSRSIWELSYKHIRLSLWFSRFRLCLQRRFLFSQMPANLAFFIAVQSVVDPPVAAPAGHQEAIPHQLVQSSLGIRNSAANSLLQEPPFHDAFHGVLRLRVLHEVGQYFIG
jgi:hypothetical protein